MRARPVLTVVVLATLLLAGCGSGGGAGGAEKRHLTVLAAASLTEVFTELADDFEATHPGVTVDLAFDSSATLAEQVSQGAPADVLATADVGTMSTVVDADLADGEPAVFATNHLVLAVPPDNPAGITGFDDLGKPGVRFVVCVKSAPCGKLAVRVLDASGVTADPASEEVDVKAVLSKVELDEADAGLVYASDVATAGDRVAQVDVPATGDNLNTYPIAALADARQPDLATAWVDLVRSRQGRAALARAGFGTP